MGYLVICDNNDTEVKKIDSKGKVYKDDKTIFAHGILGVQCTPLIQTPVVPDQTQGAVYCTIKYIYNLQH